MGMLVEVQVGMLVGEMENKLAPTLDQNLLEYFLSTQDRPIDVGQSDIQDN